MSNDPKTTLLEAVKSASEKWKSAFNSGNAIGCADMYEGSAVMHARPFGTFTGTEEILGFWQKLIDDGFADVGHLGHPCLRRLGIGSGLSDRRSFADRALWRAIAMVKDMRPFVKVVLFDHAVKLRIRDEVIVLSIHFPRTRRAGGGRHRQLDLLIRLQQHAR